MPSTRPSGWCSGAWACRWTNSTAWPVCEVDVIRQAEVEALIDERIERRIPAAYLTGEAWLQGVPFTVDERAIVPRSLIAEPLADGTLDAWLAADTTRVLDLCTGNGSLAVLAALAWPE
jgi:ribosomal protein L3 glutamine methyltransferase